MYTVKVTNAGSSNKPDNAMTFSAFELFGDEAITVKSGDEFLITGKLSGSRKIYNFFARASRNGRTLYCNTVPQEFRLNGKRFEFPLNVVDVYKLESN